MAELGYSLKGWHDLETGVILAGQYEGQSIDGDSKPATAKKRSAKLEKPNMGPFIEYVTGVTELILSDMGLSVHVAWDNSTAKNKTYRMNDSVKIVFSAKAILDVASNGFTEYHSLSGLWGKYSGSREICPFTNKLMVRFEAMGLESLHQSILHEIAHAVIGNRNHSGDFESALADLIDNYPFYLFTDNPGNRNQSDL